MTVCINGTFPFEDCSYHYHCGAKMDGDGSGK